MRHFIRFFGTSAAIRQLILFKHVTILAVISNYQTQCSDVTHFHIIVCIQSFMVSGENTVLSRIRFDTVSHKNVALYFLQ